MRILSTFRRAVMCAVLAIPVAVPAARLGAQVPTDASERLRAVLPADVAERVLARIAQARERSLPAQALENRALKYASRMVVASIWPWRGRSMRVQPGKARR